MALTREQVLQLIDDRVKQYAEVGGPPIEFNDLGADAQRQLVRASTAFNGIIRSGTYNAEKREISFLREDGTGFRIVGLPSTVGLVSEGALQAVVESINELPGGGIAGQILERTSTGSQWVNAGEAGGSESGVWALGTNLLSATVAANTDGLITTTTPLTIDSDRVYYFEFGDGTFFFVPGSNDPRDLKRRQICRHPKRYQYPNG